MCKSRESQNLVWAGSRDIMDENQNKIFWNIYFLLNTQTFNFKALLSFSFQCTSNSHGTSILKIQESQNAMLLT